MLNSDNSGSFGAFAPDSLLASGASLFDAIALVEAKCVLGRAATNEATRKGTHSAVSAKKAARGSRDAKMRIFTEVFNGTTQYKGHLRQRVSRMLDCLGEDFEKERKPVTTGARLKATPSFSAECNISVAAGAPSHQSRSNGSHIDLVGEGHEEEEKGVTIVDERSLPMRSSSTPMHVPEDHFSDSSEDLYEKPDITDPNAFRVSFRPSALQPPPKPPHMKCNPRPPPPKKPTMLRSAYRPPPSSGRRKSSSGSPPNSEDEVTVANKREELSGHTFRLRSHAPFQQHDETEEVPVAMPTSHLPAALSAPCPSSNDFSQSVHTRDGETFSCPRTPTDARSRSRASVASSPGLSKRHSHHRKDRDNSRASSSNEMLSRLFVKLGERASQAVKTEEAEGEHKEKIGEPHRLPSLSYTPFDSCGTGGPAEAPPSPLPPLTSLSPPVGGSGDTKQDCTETQPPANAVKYSQSVSTPFSSSSFSNQSQKDTPRKNTPNLSEHPDADVFSLSSLPNITTEAHGECAPPTAPLQATLRLGGEGMEEFEETGSVAEGGTERKDSSPPMSTLSPQRTEKRETHSLEDKDSASPQFLDAREKERGGVDISDCLQHCASLGRDDKRAGQCTKETSCDEGKEPNGQEKEKHSARELKRLRVNTEEGKGAFEGTERVRRPKEDGREPVSPLPLQLSTSYALHLANPNSPKPSASNANSSSLSLSKHAKPKEEAQDEEEEDSLALPCSSRSSRSDSISWRREERTSESHQMIRGAETGGEDEESTFLRGLNPDRVSRVGTDTDVDTDTLRVVEGALTGWTSWSQRGSRKQQRGGDFEFASSHNLLSESFSNERHLEEYEEEKGKSPMMMMVMKENEGEGWESLHPSVEGEKESVPFSPASSAVRSPVGVAVENVREEGLKEEEEGDKQREEETNRDIDVSDEGGRTPKPWSALFKLYEPQAAAFSFPPSPRSDEGDEEGANGTVTLSEDEQGPFREPPEVSLSADEQKHQTEGKTPSEGEDFQRDRHVRSAWEENYENPGITQGISIPSYESLGDYHREAQDDYSNETPSLPQGESEKTAPNNKTDAEMEMEIIEEKKDDQENPTEIFPLTSFLSCLGQEDQGHNHGGVVASTHSPLLLLGPTAPVFPSVKSSALSLTSPSEHPIRSELADRHESAPSPPEAKTAAGHLSREEEEKGMYSDNGPGAKQHDVVTRFPSQAAAGRGSGEGQRFLEVQVNEKTNMPFPTPEQPAGGSTPFLLPPSVLSPYLSPSPSNNERSGSPPPMQLLPPNPGNRFGSRPPDSSPHLFAEDQRGREAVLSFSRRENIKSGANSREKKKKQKAKNSDEAVSPNHEERLTRLSAEMEELLSKIQHQKKKTPQQGRQVHEDKKKNSLSLTPPDETLQPPTSRPNVGGPPSPSLVSPPPDHSTNEEKAQRDSSHLVLTDDVLVASLSQEVLVHRGAGEEFSSDSGGGSDHPRGPASAFSFGPPPPMYRPWASNRVRELPLDSHDDRQKDEGEGAQGDGERFPHTSSGFSSNMEAEVSFAGREQQRTFARAMSESNQGPTSAWPSEARKKKKRNTQERVNPTASKSSTPNAVEGRVEEDAEEARWTFTASALPDAVEELREGEVEDPWDVPRSFIGLAEEEWEEANVTVLGREDEERTAGPSPPETPLSFRSYADSTSPRGPSRDLDEAEERRRERRKHLGGHRKRRQRRRRHQVGENSKEHKKKRAQERSIDINKAAGDSQTVNTSPEGEREDGARHPNLDTNGRGDVEDTATQSKPSPPIHITDVALAQGRQASASALTSVGGGTVSENLEGPPGHPSASVAAPRTSPSKGLHPEGGESHCVEKKGKEAGKSIGRVEAEGGGLGWDLEAQTNPVALCEAGAKGVEKPARGNGWLWKGWAPSKLCVVVAVLLISALITVVLLAGKAIRSPL
uniref:Transmembrane protein n=1 Tax=Chromera velia CCMP2878 TaxID=1169474 RepID=A0A0G4FI57_9ALVE|eukprot:Cvel_17072.t1-p1 / transcript=Cvel_17072.t1 / gene=Cvel_17072 / organism=Chromera_velia_CCMP2878 / gene_product=hypothetical protein / transcript_product=hypothetical protein / location=Cvel_scaffold1346:1704-8713(-) / protein_length=1920 / sequence_SO=supercontig / SO=protein_coding / is_pseudo=false